MRLGGEMMRTELSRENVALNVKDIGTVVPENCNLRIIA